jgi:hypothetical protein
MPIGAWWCPTEVNIPSVADCGINFLFLDQKIGERTSDAYKNYVNALNERGIKFITHSLNSSASSVDSDKSPLDDDGVDWSRYDNFLGMNFFDEPTYEHIVNYLPQFVDGFNAAYPNSMFYVNLWPMTSRGVVVPEWSNNPYIDKGEVPEYKLPYYEYLDSVCRLVLSKVNADSWLSVDFYPLLENMISGSYGLEGNWLQNLELVKSAADRYGL